MKNTEANKSTTMYKRHFSGKPESLGRVAVLYGGISAEREISLQSGRAVFEGLQALGVDVVGIDVRQNAVAQLSNLTCDRAFIALHGVGGEDGKIQALLEWLNIPYTGSGVAASALALDKLKTKQIWLSSGLPTPDYVVLDAASTDIDAQALLIKLGGACFIKPVTEGSSIGMACVTQASEFKAALTAARECGCPVIAEARIVGKEFTVAILNGQALPSIELRAKNSFYDFAAKYLSEETQYLCPTDLSAEQESTLRGLALEAFHSLGCAGWGRIDFMQDQQGKFYLLEANTVPGMTSHSLVPMAAKAAELDFNALLLEILSHSL